MRTLDEVVGDYIRSVIAMHEGNISKTASVLGIDRRRLYRLIKKHNLGACMARARGMAKQTERENASE